MYFRWCALVEDFKKQTFLKDWKITSTSVAKNGIEFIATVEHEKYPFLAVQFHPEKVAFEWLAETYPHSEDALLANRFFYDILVYYARKNNHKFGDVEKEYHSLIYRNSVVDSRSSTGYFMQIYLF